MASAVGVPGESWKGDNLVIDRVNRESTAVGRVRPSVCFYSNFYEPTSGTFDLDFLHACGRLC